MDVIIHKGKCEGTVIAPPSKSMAHRLLICAALSKKGAAVHGISMSKDVEATLSCLYGMGARFTVDNDTVVFDRPICFGTERQALCCNESGSTLRFFIPLAMVDGIKTTFCGKGRLMARPMTVYENICKEENLLFLKDNDTITVEGKLRKSRYTLPGDVSSQFITGLMLALPLINGGEIVIEGKIESRSYIDLTLSALQKSGIAAKWKNENTLTLPKSSYDLKEEWVEGDYSNAAFLEALNYMGSRVMVEGLRDDSLQGDRVYREYFRLLGEGNAKLDISDCPDLGPVLMAVAAANTGAFLSGTARLKIKESDRGAAMKNLLKKFFVDCRVEENSITVGWGIKPPCEAVDGCNDHRIVMSAAILMTATGGRILGAQAVTKSYPDFFSVLEGLGIDIEYIMEEDEIIG